MESTRFVFLDETGATTTMTRRYGWAPKGERVVDATPWGHWKVTTFVAGLRASGLIAPMVLDGPMTGEVFRAYVGKVLLPELAPGDVVVLDNLAAHKVAGIREMIQAVGASLLYLPPYSPDLNPDRAGVRKAQSAPAQGCGADERSPLDDHRRTARQLPGRGVPELSHQLRL